MTMPKSIAAAAVLAVPLLFSNAPAQAATAYQHWAQGRGAYVPSKERGSTYQDDLARLGLLPPPPPPYRYRRDWRRDYWDYGPPE